MTRPIASWVTPGTRLGPFMTTTQSVAFGKGILAGSVMPQ